MDNITDMISSFRQRDLEVAVAVPRMTKLIKLANYMPCQISSCVCHRWIYNEKIDKPSRNSVCDRSHCNHKLYDHVSHLVYASEKILNALLRSIFDFENMKLKNEKNSKENQSKLSSNAETDSLLRHCKDYIYQLSDLENSNEKPPFESPTIADILKNFSLYMFSPDIFFLKVAFKITKITLENFDDWIWATPDKLQYSNKLRYNNSYKFYYQRYQEYCLTPTSNCPIIKPTCTSSKIFGQDILKYTLKVFKIFFISWCINESKKCSYSKKWAFKKIMPQFMNSLEQEVYAVDSPILNPNFLNTLFTKKMLDTLNIKLNELTLSQCYSHVMNSNITEIINNNCSNGVKIPGVNYDKIFKNYVAKDNIMNTFECINLDIGAKKSLKNKPKARVKGKYERVELIVFDCLANFTKCVLCRKQLRNMYQTQLPRLPDARISRLETDKQIKTLAIMEDGIPVGGIYFRTFNSQGFTEIVLCMLKVNLHENDYEWILMNYLKDLHIRKNILNLLVYADKEKFAYFKNHNFSTEVKISKTKYNKYIVHYEDSKLMHCNLKK